MPSYTRLWVSSAARRCSWPAVLCTLIWIAEEAANIKNALHSQINFPTPVIWTSQFTTKTHKNKRQHNKNRTQIKKETKRGKLLYNILNEDTFPLGNRQRCCNTSVQLKIHRMTTISEGKKTSRNRQFAIVKIPFTADGGIWKGFLKPGFTSENYI